MAVSYSLPKINNPQTPILTDTLPTELLARLGSGLAIPLSLINNQWTISSGSVYVAQCILLTVLTPVGTRMVNPSFGTLVPYLLFEQLTPALSSQIQQNITTALALWVPQITNTQVVVDESEANNNQLIIAIFYNIVGTNANQVLKMELDTNQNNQLSAANFILNGQPLFSV